MDKSIQRPLRIIVIEDNKDFAEILCSIIELMGHEAEAATSGLEGIVKAKARHSDVIFCDIGLPGMNGYEIARSIRSDNDLNGVYMIALSGYSGLKDIELAIESGFNKHVAKPVDINTIERIILEV